LSSKLGPLDLKFVDATGAELGALSTGLGDNSSGSLAFNAATNVITITSSIIENARQANTLNLLTQTDQIKAEADIRFVLQGIKAVPGIAQSDTDEAVLVSISTIDVNPVLQEFAESSCTSHTHDVIVAAYADLVTVTIPTQPLTGTYTEDDVRPTVPWKPNGIPLSINVEASVDNTDDSEDLSVLITVPFDSSYGGPIGTLNLLTNSQINRSVKTNGAGELEYTITSKATTAAQQRDDLNAFFSNQLFFTPAENWSGLRQIKVELTTTETPSETGAKEVDLKSQTSTALITVEVLPIADAPIIEIKGNAIGYEDIPMEVPLEVRVSDVDSEIYRVFVRGSSVPAGSTLYGVGGRIIPLDPSTGNYILSQADAEAFFYQAPLDWSDWQFFGKQNPLPRIELAIQVEVTDTSAGRTDILLTGEYT